MNEESLTEAELLAELWARKQMAMFMQNWFGEEPETLNLEDLDYGAGEETED
jgi:hypothetical protein